MRRFLGLSGLALEICFGLDSGEMNRSSRITVNSSGAMSVDTARRSVVRENQKVLRSAESHDQWDEEADAFRGSEQGDEPERAIKATRAARQSRQAAESAGPSSAARPLPEPRSKPRGKQED